MILNERYWLNDFKFFLEILSGIKKMKKKIRLGIFGCTRGSAFFPAIIKEEDEVGAVCERNEFNMKNNVGERENVSKAYCLGSVE